MYNSATMIPGSSEFASPEKLKLLPPVAIFHLCASNREDSIAWREFLLLYSVKIRLFIRGTLRQFLGIQPDANSPIAADGIHENDLFQDVILRLVENDCTAMKRFSGTTEADLLAYLAVISRSTVVDALRRRGTIKRTRAEKEDKPFTRRASGDMSRDADHLEIERGILAEELITMIDQKIIDNPSRTPARDRLVFELHFLEGLSCAQIAQCQGINLTKPSIEKILKRLIDQVQDALQSKKPRQCCNEK
jgi:RNA polymerase sigma factor (sigma-70 family)